MSREIKFRAWDKDAEVMFRDGDDCDGYPYDFVFDENSSISAQTYVDGGIFREEGGEVVEHGGTLQIDAVFMQYTGLKDRNGVEIYEGDIVRILYTDWSSKSDDDPRTLDQYLTDIAEIKVIMWKVQGFYASHKVDGYAESMEPGTHGYIEVIGNIYENPELLEEPQDDK